MEEVQQPTMHIGLLSVDYDSSTATVKYQAGATFDVEEIKTYIRTMSNGAETILQIYVGEDLKHEETFI